MCSSAGRAAVSKAAGRGFESLRTRLTIEGVAKPELDDLARPRFIRGDTVAVEVKTMEIKKTQLAAPANVNTHESTVASGQWQGFLGDVKSEFKKITWTDSEELASYTKIVVIATFLLGMGIYLMDLAIQLCLTILGFVLHLIGG